MSTFAVTTSTLEHAMSDDPVRDAIAKNLAAPPAKVRRRRPLREGCEPCGGCAWCRGNFAAKADRRALKAQNRRLRKLLTDVSQGLTGIIQSAREREDYTGGDVKGYLTYGEMNVAAAIALQRRIMRATSVP